MNEIDVHKRLDHNGIVKFEGILQNESIYAILMEFCSLGTLDDLLDERGTLTEPEVRFFMLQILDSIEYLHSSLVMHRDLKADNVFIQTGFQIKVGDFGLAVKLKNKKERRK
jgi:cell cycle serine/threonine-protein kinase CDC5/MSD2